MNNLKDKVAVSHISFLTFRILKGIFITLIIVGISVLLHYGRFTNKIKVLNLPDQNPFNLLPGDDLKFIVISLSTGLMILRCLTTITHVQSLPPEAEVIRGGRCIACSR